METRVVLFLALAVIISGCADNSSQNNTDVGSSSGKGLEIKSLGVADETLTPGQQTTLSLTLKNYHTQEITLEEVSVFNDGQIFVGDDKDESEDKTADCTPEEVQKAQQGVAPEMECTWTITAPSEKQLGAFESKPISFNVKIAYDSKIINSEPLKLQFRSVSDIENTEPVTKTYSNGEVKVSMEVESPASFAGKTMYFTAQNMGPGNVEGGYSFDYKPESVFEDCIDGYQEKTPVVGSKVEFSCQVQQDTESIRNLFTSVSYKYVKTPIVDVEVVKR